MYYRDMTFCTYWEECLSGKDCHRALTPEVQRKAEAWWGNDHAPVSIFITAPWCFEEKLKLGGTENERQV